VEEARKTRRPKRHPEKQTKNWNCLITELNITDLHRKPTFFSSSSENCFIIYTSLVLHLCSRVSSHHFCNLPNPTGWESQQLMPPSPLLNLHRLRVQAWTTQNTCQRRLHHRPQVTCVKKSDCWYGYCRGILWIQRLWRPIKPSASLRAHCRSSVIHVEVQCCCRLPGHMHEAV
jgi:hypothetical protein